MSLGLLSGAGACCLMLIIRGQNCFLWMSDNGPISLRTFLDICWGRVGKASSVIGTLRCVSGWISSGNDVGELVGTLGAGVG